MNLHELTETEASYLLFAIKKALRDRPGLTPGMEQFYDSTYDFLSTKLRRLRGSGFQAPVSSERYRFAKVRPTWNDIALSREPSNPSRDSELSESN